MNMPILYEDESLLVADKPAGVIVNRAESVKGETIQDFIESRWKVGKVDKVDDLVPFSTFSTTSTFSTFNSRSGIVHRLDKETSGCLIIAKTYAAFAKLQLAFKDRQVKKTYIALVHGELVPQEGEIRAPVGRLPWNRERFGVVPEGKAAVTRYFKIKNLKLNPSTTLRTGIKNYEETLSLVELYPESGRTHQLRVHLKYINHPIVGDYLYAGRKTQRADRLWCPRVFLHAAKIEFPHPETGEMIKVESPLPKDLHQVLNNLSPQ